MLIMAGGNVWFAGLVAFAQNGVNAIQLGITIFRSRNRTRLELHLSALRQFDRFQRPEYAAFINCMDCLHDLLLPCRSRQSQFLLCVVSVPKPAA